MFIEEEWSSDVDLKERPAGTEEKELGSRRVSFEEAVSSLGEAMGTHDDVSANFYQPSGSPEYIKERLCECECKERKL